MTDPTLEAANRAAHKVARAAARWNDKDQAARLEASSPIEAFSVKATQEARDARLLLGDAIHEYEEAERRAQLEATR